MLDLMTAESSTCDRATTGLFGQWSCAAHSPGGVTHPDHLADSNADWLPVTIPCTVASTLHANGRWSFDTPDDIDAHDWWFRTSFPSPELVDGQTCHLCFDGLATLAEVWLNGQPLLATDNMFRAYRVKVSALLQHENELAICFRSVSHDLKQ